MRRANQLPVRLALVKLDHGRAQRSLIRQHFSLITNPLVVRTVQCFYMRRDTSAKRVEIISTLERGYDPVPGMHRCNPHYLPRHPCVILLYKIQRGKVIISVGVEAG
jgi:hypothetical protein